MCPRTAQRRPSARSLPQDEARGVRGGRERRARGQADSRAGGAGGIPPSHPAREDAPQPHTAPRGFPCKPMRRRSAASEGRCRRHGEAARKGPRGVLLHERGRVQVRRFSGAKLTWLTRRPVPDARRIPPPDVNLRRGATGVRHGPSRTHGQFPRKTTRIGWHAATLFRPVFPSRTLPHYLILRAFDCCR